MKLITSTENTFVTKVNVDFYEIEGVDPDHAFLQVETRMTGDSLDSDSLKKTINCELCSSIAKIDKNYRYFRPNLIKPSFFEAIKTKNPFYNFDEHSLKIENYIVENNQYFETDPIEFIWISVSSHEIMNKKLQLIPLPILSDYIHNYFTDRYIDINKSFLEFLKNHPWVINKNKLKIDDIPYYNQENDYNICVDVFAIPDEKTFKEMIDYKNSQKYHPTYSQLYFGSPFYPDMPDWFGIKPWIKN